MRLRKAGALEFQQKQLIAAKMKQRHKEAAIAIADRDAAVAELSKTKRKLQELESARQCKHAVKTFTLDALGAGSTNAGGAKARKNRHEVLDRLSRLHAGLSDEQKMILRGGRTLGTRLWSNSMAPIGLPLLQAGFKTYSTPWTRTQPHFQISCTTKRRVSSVPAQR